MGTTKAALDAVGQLYEAACQPDGWSDCIASLASLLKARGGQFVSFDLTTKTVFDSRIAGYDPVLAELYNGVYVHFDPRAPYFFSHIGETVTSADAISPSEFQTSRIYHELLRPHAAEEIMLVSSGDGQGRCAILGMIRPERKGAFGRSDLEAFSPFLPHFQRAWQIGERLATTASFSRMTTAALDTLAVGVLLLKKDGTLAFANHVADALLRGNDGLGIRRGKVSATDARENDGLLELIANAANPLPGADASAGGGIRISRPSLKPPLSLLVAPLPVSPNEVGAKASVIVFVSDPSAMTAPPEQVLKEWYGMTRSEARLACALLAGKTVEEACQDFGISKPTARTQLRALFDKTDTRRQSDLVRLLSLQLGIFAG